MMKLQRQYLLLSSVVLLAACGGRSAVQTETAYFDLGSFSPKKSAFAIPLRGVDVSAPSWLAPSTMQYRLAYADSRRRLAYGESRWAAPPAELLETVLRRGTASEGAEGGACRLRLELDEFIQIFDSGSSSRAVIEGRVSLLAASGGAVLARRNLSLAKPAVTADAKGGVNAFANLSVEMVGELSTWLGKLATEAPKLVDKCRG